MAKKINFLKKGQFEILGMAVVVIIILMVLIFFFVLIVPGNERSLAVDVARTRIGANTINTLLKTTTNCKQLTFSELIVDCAEDVSVTCGTQTSCEYIESRVQPIFAQTLYNWGIDYEFDILKKQGNDFESLNIKLSTKTCTTKEHFEQIIPTKISLAKVSLDLC